MRTKCDSVRFLKLVFGFLCLSLNGHFLQCDCVIESDWIIVPSRKVNITVIKPVDQQKDKGDNVNSFHMNKFNNVENSTFWENYKKGVENDWIPKHNAINSGYSPAKTFFKNNTKYTTFYKTYTTPTVTRSFLPVATMPTIYTPRVSRKGDIVAIDAGRPELLILNQTTTLENKPANTSGEITNDLITIMTKPELGEKLSHLWENFNYDLGEEGRGVKVKKKYKKFLIPLLIAYKLKFFTLIPVLIGGLLLLVGSTGLAGFFFALFAAIMGLKVGGSHSHH